MKAYKIFECVLLLDIKNVNIYLDIEMGILQIPPYVNQNKYGGWEIYLTQKFNKEKLILDTPQ